MSAMQVAIYAASDRDGKRFLSTLKRRIQRAEIRAWEVRRVAPLTLVHSGDRYQKIRVSFLTPGSPAFSRAARETLGSFGGSTPSLLASISEGPSADRVLGFLVGLLTRHAEPLGVTGVGIPLR
jgi:hypothetical protein